MLYILAADLKADNALAIISLLRVHLKNGNLHIRKCCGNIGNKGDTVECVYLNICLVYLSVSGISRTCLPGSIDPSVSIIGVFKACNNVGTVALVY